MQAKSRMLECICCQCREHRGQFADWLQCDSCDLYGEPEEFDDDPQRYLCTECYAECLKLMKGESNG